MLSVHALSQAVKADDSTLGNIAAAFFYAYARHADPDRDSSSITGVPDGRWL